MAKSKHLWLLVFAFLALSCQAKHDLAEKNVEVSFVMDDSSIRDAVQLWNGNAQDRADAVKLYGPMEDWDTSRVTSFAGLFRGQHRFQGEGLHKWDTSKVTSMSDAFSGCSDFHSTKPLKWNTTAVTTMSRMFLSAISFNGNLSFLNTIHVTDMSFMFHVSLKNTLVTIAMFS
jgi:Mycoplasma protein of unknown function, DUF285